MTDPTADPPVLRLGARTSPLARAQVDLVAGLLAARGAGLDVRRGHDLRRS